MLHSPLNCINMGKYKILIDTDLGADVDDQLALYAALLNKDVEIVGITTVCGNVDERAREVKKILHLMNKDSIPVYKGMINGMSKDFSSDKHLLTFQEDILNSKYKPENDDIDLAISFIISCAKKYKDELYILAIGPATNIAYATLKDKEAMQNVKAIYMMGGCVFTNQPEWNVFCDPKAVSILIENDLPFYLVCKECTAKTKLNDKNCQKILELEKQDGIKNYIGFSARKWIESRNVGITLHDPLTLYAITNPEYIHFVKQRIACEEEGVHTKGFIMNYSLTNIYPKNKGYEVYVSNYVNEKKMIKHFMKNVINHKDKTKKEK